MGKSITLAAIRSTATTASPGARPRLIQTSGRTRSSVSVTMEASLPDSTGRRSVVNLTGRSFAASS
jgi:hypothetical protein